MGEEAIFSWAVAPRTRDSRAKLTAQEGLRVLQIPLHLVNSELLLKIRQFSLFFLLLFLPTHLTIKSCHVTNTVPFYQCIARLKLLHTATCTLSAQPSPEAGLGNTLSTKAHFKCQICSSAALDTATRSPARADRSNSSPRLSLHTCIRIPELLWLENPPKAESSL